VHAFALSESVFIIFHLFASHIRMMISAERSWLSLLYYIAEKV